MKSLFNMTVAAAALAAGAMLCATAPAQAQIGISIGVPGVHVAVGVPAWYYGPGFYPPGPCDAYNYYYQGDCGYAVYNGPVVFDGVPVEGVHYYRWEGGRPIFWYRGGWHEWAGWNRVNIAWDHREGWGWHDGHWDRDWGRAHWHDHDVAHDHDGHDHDWHDHDPDHKKPDPH